MRTSSCDGHQMPDFRGHHRITVSRVVVRRECVEADWYSTALPRSISASAAETDHLTCQETTRTEVFRRPRVLSVTDKDGPTASRADKPMVLALS